MKTFPNGLDDGLKTLEGEALPRRLPELAPANCPQCGAELYRLEGPRRDRAAGAGGRGGKAAGGCRQGQWGSVAGCDRGAAPRVCGWR